MKTVKCWIKKWLWNKEGRTWMAATTGVNPRLFSSSRASCISGPKEEQSQASASALPEPASTCRRLLPRWSDKFLTSVGSIPATTCCYWKRKENTVEREEKTRPKESPTNRSAELDTISPNWCECASYCCAFLFVSVVGHIPHSSWPSIQFKSISIPIPILGLN